MALTKVLITVKTYPTLSQKYSELVCTAGFREDGSWIRIYPVPFRKLRYNDRFDKWQWVELDLVKNTSDFRPESYRPANIDSGITIGEKVDTKGAWIKRKELISEPIWTSFSELISEAKGPKKTSLAILKPKEVLKFICKPCAREWDSLKIKQIIANNAQGSLFNEEETKHVFKVVKKIPYEFSYVFTTEDGKKRTLMIEDWELGALYRKYIDDAQDCENIACHKVIEKYFDYMINERDLHFIVGTTKQYHNIAPNPFIIIGTFYPPKINTSQLKLF